MEYANKGDYPMTSQYSKSELESEFEYDFPSWECRNCGNWVSCESELLDHLDSCKAYQKHLKEITK